jgi:hypothetical protein
VTSLARRVADLAYRTSANSAALGAEAKYNANQWCVLSMS